MHDIAALEQMTTGELAQLYDQLHGQPCRTRHRAYLLRKVAWRVWVGVRRDTFL